MTSPDPAHGPGRQRGSAADVDSPLSRPIGGSNLIRGLIALVAVLAIGSALVEGHIGLGVAGVVFIVIAVVLGTWAWRARRAP